LSLQILSNGWKEEINLTILKVCDHLKGEKIKTFEMVELANPFEWLERGNNPHHFKGLATI